MGEGIRGVLFDKDGTLINFSRTWAPALRQAALFASRGDESLADRLLLAGGCDPATGEVTGGSLLAGGTNRELAEAWIAEIDGWELDHLTRHLDEIFTRLGVPHAEALADLPDLFEALAARGLILGVATSDCALSAQLTLERFEALERVAFLSGYDSGHGSKPGPGQALAFCTACGLAPGEIAVVGDNSHDLEMAANAGAGLKIAVLSGTGTRDQLAPLADVVIASIAEIGPVLEAG